MMRENRILGKKAASFLVCFLLFLSLGAYISMLGEIREKRLLRNLKQSVY